MPVYPIGNLHHRYVCKNVVLTPAEEGATVQRSTAGTVDSFHSTSVGSRLKGQWDCHPEPTEPQIEREPQRFANLALPWHHLYVSGEFAPLPRDGVRKGTTPVGSRAASAAHPARDGATHGGTNGQQRIAEGAAAAMTMTGAAAALPSAVVTCATMTVWEETSLASQTVPIMTVMAMAKAQAA